MAVMERIDLACPPIRWPCDCARGNRGVLDDGEWLFNGKPREV